MVYILNDIGVVLCVVLCVALCVVLCVVLCSMATWLLCRE